MPGKAQPGPQAEPAPEVTLAELDRRLARIEELITAATASSSLANIGSRFSGSSTANDHRPSIDSAARSSA